VLQAEKRFGVVEAICAEGQLHPNFEAGLALAGSRRRRQKQTNQDAVDITESAIEG
jgi:hypothetical protein